MSQNAQRILSLLPSATEIVCALGLGDRLIGVTHECDYPPEARAKPWVTSSVIESESLSSADIDQAVRDSLADRSTIYGLDRELLLRLEPDLILTQELCEVCAVGPDLVHEALTEMPVTPRVVALEPRTLGEVLQSIRLVGDLTGCADAAGAVVAQLEARLKNVRSAVEGLPQARVLTLEWLDPVFVGGHWVPEMVEAAGGVDVLGHTGQPSELVPWERVLATEPDIVVAMPCGFDLDRTKRELDQATFPTGWTELPAVVGGKVYAVDGSAYFNRPGPRLIDGVEILASILHPSAFSSASVGAFERYPSRPASAFVTRTP